jgi:hypothetical protein
MRKSVLIAISMLIVAVSGQTASGAGRHTRKTECSQVTATPQFRNAYGAVTLPTVTESERAYWEGHGLSAPAGH